MTARKMFARIIALIVLLLSLLMGALAPWDGGGVELLPKPPLGTHISQIL